MAIDDDGHTPHRWATAQYEEEADPQIPNATWTRASIDLHTAPLGSSSPHPPLVPSAVTSSFQYCLQSPEFRNMAGRLGISSNGLLSIGRTITIPASSL